MTDTPDDPVPLDPGPIDPEFVGQMTAIAKVLDEYFNGEGCAPEDKKIGFFMTCFEFATPGRFNYISNADKLDVREMLADIVRRIDQRVADEKAAK